MSLCGSLLARWRRFLGKLSPTHALLFQLLLLALLAANVAGVVIAAKRLKHSYTFPISVLSVRRLDSPPAFTLFLFSLTSSNMSLICTQQWGSHDSCPRQEWESPAFGGPVVLIAGTPTQAPFSAGDAFFNMELSAANAVSGDCVGVQVLGVGLDEITPDSMESIVSYAAPDSLLSFCPQFAEGETFMQFVDLSFQALEDIHGHVNYTVSASTDGGKLRLTPGASMPPTINFNINLQGELRVPWEAQEYSYTVMDFLSSVFANFNISLTVLAFLFPWKQVVESTQREFRLACSACGHQEHQPNAHDEEDVSELDHSPQQQLKQRILPVNA